MGDLMQYLAIGACLVTAGILLIGIRGFGTGKVSPRGQNKLMRMRIAAQFVAIILILITVLIMRQGS